MQTEQSLRAIIDQHSQSIKRLEETIVAIRTEKKKYQTALRDVKWEKRENRRRRARN